jgi:signal transduction histidine kinase
MSESGEGGRAGYESARLQLARLRLAGTDARAAAMRQIAETTARALNVARAGIWAFKGTGGRLRGVCQYQLSSGTYVDTGLPDGLDLPVLIQEITARRVMAVNDAGSDPRVAELKSAYLDVQQIASLMVAPVIRDGSVVGAICCETVGVRRDWSLADRDFGACAADMAALFLEQADRLEIEATLHDRRETALAAEAMASLGRLARSVAHDVNNVLGALDLIGSALQIDTRADIARYGSEVRGAVAFGSQLVDRLLLFGRESAKPEARVDLAALLDEITPVLVRLSQAATLDLFIEARPVVVPVDAAEMKQVVLNLCVNAADAVVPGGHIRVELRAPRLDEPISPTMAVLAVIDDGIGMDEETRAHIFEPYFSRKPGGAGIGLSTVYGVVKRAAGTILVDSAPGAGTTFRIALPRAGG